MKKIGFLFLLVILVAFLGMNTEKVQAADLSPSHAAGDYLGRNPAELPRSPAQTTYSCPTNFPSSTPELSQFTYDFDNPFGSWSFTSIDLPDGMSLSSSGHLSWTPTEMQGGWGNPESLFSFSVFVTDPAPLGTCYFSLLVTEVNSPISGPDNLRVDLSVLENQHLTWTVPIETYDSDRPVGPHSYAVGPNGTSSFPNNSSMSQAGVFSWNPTEYDAWCDYTCTQTVSFRLVITDGPYTLYMLVWIQVTETNSPPAISTISNKTIPENSPYSFSFTYSDPDYYTQPLTVSLDGNNYGASVSAANGTGTFSWTPTEAQGPGSYNFTVKVQDYILINNVDKSLSTTMPFNITVSEVNTPPIVTPISDKTINEINSLSFSVIASDSDLPAQTPLVYSLIFGTPEATGAKINSSGVFTWLPTESQGPDLYPVTVKVCDSIGGTSGCSEASFKIQVNEVNLPPQIAAFPNKTILEGQVNTLSVSASDPDIPKQTLKYYLDGVVPEGTSINADNGVITIVPTETMGGNDFTITVRVCDLPAPGLCATTAYSYNVVETYQSPIMTLSPAGPYVINEGAPFSVTVSASSPDIPPQPFELGVSELPDSLLDLPSFNAATGYFIWQPHESRGPGDWAFTFTATTPNNTGTITLNIKVLEVNQAPTLITFPTDLVAKENQPFTFDVKPFFSDGDLPAQKIYYLPSANLPDQLALDKDTGLISWTPAESQGGQTISIPIHAQDSYGANSADNVLQIKVEEVNEAPVFTSTLANRTVLPGDTVSFLLSATDPDLPTQALYYTLKRLDTGELLLDRAVDPVVSWSAPVEESRTVKFEAQVCDPLGLCAIQNFAVSTSVNNKLVYSTFIGLIFK